MSVPSELQLLRLAEAELLNEAKRAAVLHSTAGPSGWQPCPKPNKKFLANTLLQTISSNRLISKKTEQQREKRLGIVKKERKLKQKNSNNNFIYKIPETKSKEIIKKETVLVKDLKKLKSHKSKSDEKDKIKKKKRKKEKKKKR